MAAIAMMIVEAVAMIAAVCAVAAIITGRPEWLLIWLGG